MLARFEGIPSGRGWVLEPKLDGFRCLICTHATFPGSQPGDHDARLPARLRGAAARTTTRGTGRGERGVTVSLVPERLPIVLFTQDGDRIGWIRPVKGRCDARLNYQCGLAATSPLRTTLLSG